MHPSTQTLEQMTTCHMTIYHFCKKFVKRSLLNMTPEVCAPPSPLPYHF